MRPIFLIGLMCSGKTTLGHALSVRTGMELVDLDDLIESRAGQSIKEIFSTRGEKAFRELERQALSDVCSRHDVIVACGGGTPCQPGAMDLMNQHGITVWLQTAQPRLVSRLMDGRAKRPLIAHIDSADEMGEFIQNMHQKRAPYYSQAQHTFDSTELDDLESVDRAVERFVSIFL